MDKREKDFAARCIRAVNDWPLRDRLEWHWGEPLSMMLDDLIVEARDAGEGNLASRLLHAYNDLTGRDPDDPGCED